MTKPRSEHYQLGNFVQSKLIESTSSTLLTLVSVLVSRGKNTRQSMSLAQCIQQHVGGNGRNQTTLGLGVKLHHKYGISELIRTINERGITCTYDEVLRFREGRLSCDINRTTKKT